MTLYSSETNKHTLSFESILAPKALFKFQRPQRTRSKASDFKCYKIEGLQDIIQTPGARFFRRSWLRNQDEAEFSAMFSCLKTCNSSVLNTAWPLLRDTVMIPQNVTLSSTYRKVTYKDETN